MNWNKELDKIANNLKEEKNVNISIHSTDNDGTRNSSTNNIPVRIIRKLTIEREVNQVITVEAALGDLDKIAKNVELDSTSKIIEAVKVLVKMLSTVRSNQLLCEEDKVKIREAKAKRNQEKEVK